MPISLDSLLSPSDAGRLGRVLARLELCDLRAFLITGGVALEAALGHGAARMRRLADLDLLVPGFAALPAMLGDEFLVRHAHPCRPGGKMALQLVDEHERLRIDIFTAYGGTIERAQPARFGPRRRPVASLEDMVCRLASLLLCAARGDPYPVPAKCADDFCRAMPRIDRHIVEAAWAEHRGPADPTRFAEVWQRVQPVLDGNSDRFVETVYPADPGPPCPHCSENTSFPLADPARVLAVLGYC